MEVESLEWNWPCIEVGLLIWEGESHGGGMIWHEEMVQNGAGVW
jgi:hypothetical protein